MKNTFIQNIQKLQDRFEHALETARQDKNPKSIHKLRVAIKKIFALARMAEQIDRNNFKKKHHFRILTSLFKSAGELREAQLNSRKAASDPAMDHYIGYQELIVQSALTKLELELDSFKTDELVTLNEALITQMKHYDDARITSDLFTYFDYLLGRIEKLSGKPGNGINLHKIRRHVRKTVEILKVLRELVTDEYLGTLHSNLKRLNEEIGDWHDSLVLDKSLQEYLDYSDVPDREYIESYRRKILEENRLLGERLIRDIRDLLKSGKNSPAAVGNASLG